MGLLSALNKMSGYSAENMNKVFDEFLPVMDSKAICPIGISLKAKGLFSSKPIASGFATITNTSLFVICILPQHLALLYIHSRRGLLLGNDQSRKNQRGADYGCHCHFFMENKHGQHDCHHR